MFHQADTQVCVYDDPEYAERKRGDFVFLKRDVGRDVGGEEASGETERRGGKFKTGAAYHHDFYGDSDHDYASGIFGNEAVSKWETS